MNRAWIALGADHAHERVAADTDGSRPRPTPASVWVLQRMPGDTPARWDRVHQPGPPRSKSSGGFEVFRVRMEAAGATYGSLWAARSRDRGMPDRTETRLLAAAADQVGQALHQDRLAAEASAAEIARQGDALKSALLQSVSHDLRTPLATIRAAAGTLRPDSRLSDEDRAESADAIDREVEYLNRLVTNLLDLSRIEAGALKPDLETFELDDLVGRTIERLGPRLEGRPLEVALQAPPVRVDPVFVDEAVTNALENVLKYTPIGTPIRVSAAANEPGFVRLTIEDAGPGVPDDALPHLFDKFYRVPGGRTGSRSGTGVGLAVVRGLTEATGGQASARRSPLGGLAIDLDLPLAVDAPAHAETELRVEAGG
jgi:two-component system sensor histidine kinase KdpD